LELAVIITPTAAPVLPAKQIGDTRQAYYSKVDIMNKSLKFIEIKEGMCHTHRRNGLTCKIIRGNERETQRT